MLRANFKPITPEDELDIDDFFIDTDNGLRPFFFTRYPTTYPRDILLLRLKNDRNVPFINAKLKQWNFQAEEVVGKRIVNTSFSR